MIKTDPLPLPVSPPFPDPPNAGPVEPPATPETPVPFSPGPRRVNGHNHQFEANGDGPNGTPPPIPPPPIVPIPLPDDLFQAGGTPPNGTPLPRVLSLTPTRSRSTRETGPDGERDALPEEPATAATEAGSRDRGAGDQPATQAEVRR